MASFNRVIMMGNLTRDPEYKQLSSGQAVCRLGLASNRQFKNKQTGMMVQEVCFVDIDVWGPQAESCNQYLQKGRSVLIEGRLKLDTWVDNDGQRRNKHSIVADRVTFLPATGQAEAEFGNMTEESSSVATNEPEVVAAPQEAPAKKSKKTTKTGEVELKEEGPFEDDLPF